MLCLTISGRTFDKCFVLIADASNPSFNQWCELINVLNSDEELFKGGHVHPKGKAHMERKWEELKTKVEAVEGATAVKSVAQWKTVSGMSNSSYCEPINFSNYCCIANFLISGMG